MEKTIEYINIGYVSLLSIYHVFTGVISMFFPNFAFHFYKKFYGCDPLSKDMLVIVLKPWGALSIFAGIMGLFAVWAITLIVRPVQEWKPPAHGQSILCWAGRNVHLKKWIDTNI